MLCRFWCLHIVCSVHTQFPHDIQNRETSNTSDAANSTRRFFSGSSNFRKSSWKTTNQRNLHQRHQQHANITQRCVGFDVCTSFVVCAHSFHTTSKTEKPQTHRMWQNCTRRFFWFIKFQEKQLENDKSTKTAPMTPTARYYRTTLCRFWCLHVVCSVHTQFPHDI